jgi:hypothetical protein
LRRNQFPPQAFLAAKAVYAELRKILSPGVAMRPIIAAASARVMSFSG